MRAGIDTSRARSASFEISLVPLLDFCTTFEFKTMHAHEQEIRELTTRSPFVPFRPIMVTLRGEPLVRVIPATKSGQPRVQPAPKHGNAVFKGNVVKVDFSE